MLELKLFLLFRSSNEVTKENFGKFNFKTPTQVQTQKIGNFRINDLCVKKQNCKAMLVAKGKPFKVQETKAPFVGNPGANYCWDVGAKNRVLKDEKNNQYDFCVFEDGSMIDAWDLYRAHYPSPVIK